jgi:hypothetical protein
VPGHVAGDQPDPAVGERERVVPVAADGRSVGGGQVADREVKSRDPRQGVGQQGALQRLRDRVLAGEGVRVGQPHPEPPAEFLHHRDVGRGERRPPRPAAEHDDAERALPAEQRGGDRAARLHEPDDVDRFRLGPGPGGDLGGDVKRQHGGAGAVGALGEHRAPGGDRLLAQVGDQLRLGGLGVAERAGEQHAVGGRQEHHAVVGQDRDHQLGNLAQELIAVPGGGDQRPGPHEEGEPFPGAVRVGPGGAGAGQQLRAFLLGPLPGGQVDDEGRPAQRAAVEYRRADQHRHPVPFLVHVLLLERLARPGPQQLLPGLGLNAGPPRRGNLPPVKPPGLEVVPAVADHAEVGVVGLVDQLLARDHHAEHVGVPQPAEQGGTLPQRLLGLALLGQVGEDRVGPAGPSPVVAGVGNRGDPHPAQLAGPSVPEAGYHAADDHAGPQRHPHRQVLGRVRRAVLAQRLALRHERPRRQRGQVHAQDLAGRRVHPDDGPVGVVVDDTLRHGLEQRAVPLLRRGAPGQRVEPARIPS